MEGHSSTMESTNSLLLLGESDVGKTHFGAQLLLRLRTQECELGFRESPTNIEAFDAAIKNLNNGKAAIHTASGVYVESHWPLKDSTGNSFDLVWPDYAGEQLTHITTRRYVTPEWKERIKLSSGWILMLRLAKLAVPQDTFVKPLAHIAPSSAVKTPKRVCDQARILELLQILLFTRSVGTLQPITNPRITIVLSCWDELKSVRTGDKPHDVLATRLPLVFSFLTSNWTTGGISIFGLSALERALTESDPDAGYIDQGPASFGFIIDSEGKKSKDLTLPIRSIARS
jgi:hypothetical protein